MKDNFSAQAKEYARFRPAYPEELFAFILTQTSNKLRAWDCATGNGQVALVLANHFDEVYATDISEAQLKNAPIVNNVIYKKEQAEQSSFPGQFFDLVTVAQAIHWFRFDDFYKEVKRTLKPGGILAVIGYNLVKTNSSLDKIIYKLYNQVLGGYWDKERKYIDDNYTTVPFPFKEITAPYFSNTFNWTFEQLTGYLETWSAIQHYIKANNQHPVDIIINELKENWGNAVTRTIEFPIMLLIGKV